MIGATLTTRLAQDGITKSSVTAFSLVFLAYNFKFLWAWVVEGVRLPLIGRLGQRVSWMLLTGTLVNLLGSRGGDWEILATSAFVSIAVPLFVFFAMQKYLVRGLLAGSVK